MPAARRRPLRIGLTGGIGSGKSEVAKRFAALGVPVIDADAIAHRLVAPGLPAFDEIVQAFGAALLDTAGNIDRARLRRRVFENPAERARLEAILHPRIRAEMEAETTRIDTPYCVLVIPLLIESGQRDLVDRVLVVDAEEARRIAWVQARSGLDEAEIRAIMAAQADRNTRLRAADDVLHNDGDLARLDAEVRRLHELYLSLAQQE